MSEDPAKTLGKIRAVLEEPFPHEGASFATQSFYFQKQLQRIRNIVDGRPLRREAVAERIEAMIAAGDTDGLLQTYHWGPCGCIGNVDNEPQCICRMTAAQVAEAVDIQALERREIVRKQG